MAAEKQYLVRLIFLGLTLGCSFVIAQQPASDENSDSGSNVQVDFSHQVVPMLREHCIECHGGERAEGGFSMNSRSLWLESGHVELKDAASSYVLELISSSDETSQMPPPDRKRLTKSQVNLLNRWIAEGMAWEPGFTFSPTRYQPPLRPRNVALPPVVDGRSNPVDRFVDAYLAQHDLPRQPVVQDGAFLRRVSLDLVGLLPDPELLQRFTASQAPDKRERVINELLADRVAYAEHWLTFYNDLLRNDYSGTGFITGGRRQITNWLYSSLVANMPYDEFARELIAPASTASSGFIDGIKWRGNVSAGQTLEIQFAQSVSQAFLGVNLKCASCHDSFIDRWRLEDAYGMAAIYSERELELYRCDKPTGVTAKPKWLFPEIGDIDPAISRPLRLKQLATLMTSQENGRFARTMVNRLWHRLMGRGLVHPLDAMQTRPWDEDLLEFLAAYLVQQDYDLKQVLRLIASSEVYQWRIQSQASGRETQQQAYLFRGPEARRLTAEQFVDAVHQLTETGPSNFDAPVFRGGASAADSEDALQFNAKWIWDSQGLPAQPGEVAFRKNVKLTEQPKHARLVITCDNRFRLFLAGRELASSEDWTKPLGISLSNRLKAGNNQLVVLATNDGESANPAGCWVQLVLTYADGREEWIGSDESWLVSDSIPSTREGRLGRLSKDTQPATELVALPVWQQSVLPAARRILSRDPRVAELMVRASLLKNNALMRSLGRPHREQIVSMRPSELTTLEALDLANAEPLAETLKQGARNLIDQPWSDSSELVRHVFRHALSREPTEDELSVGVTQLGAQPTAESVEDFLWAVCMLPEFLFVR